MHKHTNQVDLVSSLLSSILIIIIKWNQCSFPTSNYKIIRSFIMLSMLNKCKEINRVIQIRFYWYLFPCDNFWLLHTMHSAGKRYGIPIKKIYEQNLEHSFHYQIFVNNGIELIFDCEQNSREFFSTAG